MGLPGIKGSALTELRKGNELMLFSFRVFKQCQSKKVPVTLENPQYSRCWLTPGALRILAGAEVTSVICHFCMFGTRWKKPTRVIGARVDLDGVDLVCSGRLCSRTHRPHFVLQGRAPNGTYWTSLATSYPQRFARALALIHHNGAMAVNIDSAWASLGGLGPRGGLVSHFLVPLVALAGFAPLPLQVARGTASTVVPRPFGVGPLVRRISTCSGARYRSRPP